MKLIVLTQGKFAQVDNEDFEWLNQWKWCATKAVDNWYAVRFTKVDGNKITQYMHILIMGDNPLKLNIDHCDVNGLNNQRSNLRFCTIKENAMNRNPRKNCSSKYKGVYWDKIARKWKAYIRVDKKLINLGYFSIEEDAARAYDTSCVGHFKEFAHPNFKFSI